MANGDDLHEIFQRVSQTEAAVAALEADVANIKSTVGATGQAVLRIEQKLSERAKTDWNPILAGAGVIVLVLGSVVTFTFNVLDRDIRERTTGLGQRITTNYQILENKVNDGQSEDFQNRVFIWEEMKRETERIENRIDNVVRYLERSNDEPG